MSGYPSGDQYSFFPAGDSTGGTGSKKPPVLRGQPCVKSGVESVFDSHISATVGFGSIVCLLRCRIKLEKVFGQGILFVSGFTERAAFTGISAEIFIRIVNVFSVSGSLIEVPSVRIASVRQRDSRHRRWPGSSGLQGGRSSSHRPEERRRLQWYP